MFNKEKNTNSGGKQMKVIFKGGSPKKNNEIEAFFVGEIFPILSFGIAIERSNAVIIVHEKKSNGAVETYIDPTAEVIVELTEKVRNLAKNGTCDDTLKEVAGNFYDEALAIKRIEELKPSFSVEYYSCRYTPPSSSK